jgi:glycerate kinase
VHVLVAPDKFKGSLSAAEVAGHLAAGLTRAAPGTRVTRLPVADGGERTLGAVAGAGFRRIPVRVSGATGVPIESAIAQRGRTAVAEMAAASALPGGRPAPLEASLGTGELIRAALDLVCTEIVLGIGGSTCTDGGAGLLVALGARLLGARDDLVPSGAAVGRVEGVALRGLDPRLAGTSFVLASDVDNPLLGNTGAAAAYAPQKGARDEEVRLLEPGLRCWVDAVARALGPAALSVAAAPGAGAAGAVGYAALAILGATRRPGIHVVLGLTGFATHVHDAALVITGKGSLDHQMLHGKVPVGVAAAARRAEVPAVAVAGQSVLSPVELARAGLRRIPAHRHRARHPAVHRPARAAAPATSRSHRARLAGRRSDMTLLTLP